MNDEHLYAKVADELRNHEPITGLWAKAFAESNGVESAAKALYLRYRVAQLAEVERQIEAQKSADAIERGAASAGMPIPLFLFGVILAVVIVVIIT